MIRKNKHWYLIITFSSIAAMLFVGGWLLLFGFLSPERGEEAGETTAVFSSGGPLEVILRRHYVCGEVLEERTLVTATAETVRKRYSDWEVVEQTDHRLVLRKEVEDLAPQCKANGFFGITDEGLMTLFYGPPDEGNVIRTFYQLDLERLESSLPKEVARQLREGIRVSSVTEFHSVLSTYAEFIRSDS